MSAASSNTTESPNETLSGTNVALGSERGGNMKNQG